MDKLEPCPPTEYQIECWPPRQTGGQVAGGVQNGVRITHVASGLQAVCTDERSQHRNREIAMAMIEGGLTCPMYRGPMPTAAAPPALCQRTLEAAAKVADDWATVADTTFLSWQQKAKDGADGLEMTGACALGMSHQARRIASRILALGKDDR